MNQNIATRGERQFSPIESFRNQLERMTEQFARVMPKGTIERFKRIVITTISDHPDLLRCSPKSLSSACMRAAQDGLLLDGKEAAFVAYGAEAQYIPMVGGLRKKVRNSGLLRDWNCQCVQEGDEFDFALGDRPYVHHRKSLRGGRSRPVIAAYSIATFPDGTKSYEVMNVDEIEDVRSKSKARKGPWADPIFYPEMCRKTVARLHAKQLPMSTDLELILRREDEADNAIEQQTREPAPSLPRPSSVGNALDQFAAGVLSPPPDTATTTESVARDVAVETTAAEGADDQGAGAGAEEHSHPARAPDVDAQQEDGEHRAALQAAYEKGKAARAAGHAKKALPGELRSSDRTREALAWTAGWDGGPMPVS